MEVRSHRYLVARFVDAISSIKVFEKRLSNVNDGSDLTIKFALVVERDERQADS